MKRIIASAMRRLSKRSKTPTLGHQPIKRAASNQNKWLSNADEVFAYLERDKNA
ncbi:MAG: hypothetical protein AAF569_08745 [Pseudomonadota bacterium]